MQKEEGTENQRNRRRGGKRDCRNVKAREGKLGRDYKPGKNARRKCPRPSASNEEENRGQRGERA